MTIRVTRPCSNAPNTRRPGRDDDGRVEEEAPLPEHEGLDDQEAAEEWTCAPVGGGLTRLVITARLVGGDGGRTAPRA